MRTLAEYAGFLSTGFTKDYGDDFALQRVISISNEGTREFYTAGEIISVQVKCTTQKNAPVAGEKLKFRLKVKNYNHLVRRRDRRNLGGGAGAAYSCSGNLAG